MPGNKDLLTARTGKKDEFYTGIEEIATELCVFQKGNYVPNPIYADGLRGKMVLCNCNDTASTFRKFFKGMFKAFGLKKLVSVSYGEQAYKIEETDSDTIKKRLKGDGSFLSDEGIQLIKDADVVCTNPPFSLLAQFIQTMMELDKPFLILGDINVLKNKSVFSYFKTGKFWMGSSIHSGDRPFFVPDEYVLKAAGCGLDKDSKKYIKVKNVRWFTNIGEPQYQKPLHLTQSYWENIKEYPKYENLDAINVEKTKNIPKDYDGTMGVPLTFADKYNPKQFELIGLDTELSDDRKALRILEKGKEKNKFVRLIIKPISTNLSESVESTSDDKEINKKIFIPDKN